MADLMEYKVDEAKININGASRCSEGAVMKEDDQTESSKSEMTGIREENMRLKNLLQQIENDYKSLQMKFIDVFQESKKNGSPFPAMINDLVKAHSKDDDHDHEDQDQELVSLRLGTSPTQSKKEDTVHVTSNNSRKFNDGIKLGLDHYSIEKRTLKTDGNDHKYSLTGKKEDEHEGGEKWQQAAGKVLKTQRNGDEEFSQTSVKRARVCVRARCDTPTMNDGCQWRKYGQKIAKGNPCPRAYYRCTASPSCPVRKQVQRCMEDMSILITTYEGSHNHPLPLSATAMASTTSAAASMLLTGSSTSQPSATASPPSSLYGQPSFHTYNNSTTQPYFIPTTSATSPTITLDLTTNPSTTPGGFSLYSSTSQMNPRFPATSLSFSSMDPNVAPTGWGGGTGYSYGTTSSHNYDHHSLLPQKPGRDQNFNQGSSQQDLTETLTKVITSDPSFRSVIAAMVSTVAADGAAGKVSNEIKGENHGSKLKWGEQISAVDLNPLM